MVIVRRGSNVQYPFAPIAPIGKSPNGKKKSWEKIPISKKTKVNERHQKTNPITTKCIAEIEAKSYHGVSDVGENLTFFFPRVFEHLIFVFPSTSPRRRVSFPALASVPARLFVLNIPDISHVLSSVWRMLTSHIQPFGFPRHSDPPPLPLRPLSYSLTRYATGLRLALTPEEQRGASPCSHWDPSVTSQHTHLSSRGPFVHRVLTFGPLIVPINKKLHKLLNSTCNILITNEWRINIKYQVFLLSGQDICKWKVTSTEVQLVGLLGFLTKRDKANCWDTRQILHE